VACKYRDIKTEVRDLIKPNKFHLRHPVVFYRTALETKDPEAIYCSKSEIDNTGIVFTFIFRIIIYFNDFKTVILICSMYYALFYVKYWPEDDLNVSRNMLPYILRI
jgi:hypothetical protein